MRIDTGLLSGDLAGVARLARAAEDGGYDGLWTAEAGHDPYLACAVAATATERVSIGTHVKGHMERRYSTPWLPPGPRLREMIQLVRHIWDVWQNGTKPGFTGKF